MSYNPDDKNVIYQGKVLSPPFNSTRDKNLLSYLQQQGIEVHYQCLEGYCGACRCKIIAGEVDYPIFPMACIRDAEILTCCSLPVGDIELAPPF